MKQRKPFLLRISPELYEALETLAQQDFRSVNGQIEFLLKESLARRGRTVPDRAALADETLADKTPADETPGNAPGVAANVAAHEATPVEPGQ
jgi:hypothetical protein